MQYTESRPDGQTGSPTTPRSEKIGHATVVYHAAPDAALKAAQEELFAAGGGTLINGVLFNQGKRPMIVTALPFSQVKGTLDTDSASLVSTVEEVQNAKNRPQDDKHVEEIKSYIVDNFDGTFILPSLTVNITEDTTIHTFEVVSQKQPPTRNAYIALPSNPVLVITDGQHRKAAIGEAYADLLRTPGGPEKLNHSSVPLTITMESDYLQLHQDFADASKSKEMSPSLLAVYDRRNPANGLVMDLVDRCPIFKGKTDSSSVKLSRRSPGMFLTNMIRQAVKTFMTGGYGIGEAEFEERAKRDFTSNTTPEYRRMRDFMVRFLNLATDSIPKLREYADLSPDEASKLMPEIRNWGLLCLTSTGLAMLSRVGWAVLKDQPHDWESHMLLLGDMDWNRSAQEWSDLGIVAGGTRVSTGHNSVKAGAKYVAEAIGLDLPSLRAVGERQEPE
jgi:DNA sulfur modification protein DndB